MTPEQENRLRQLLRLKRYEQPPPGYFNNFPRQVMARIRAGGATDRAPAADRRFEEVSWVRRVLAAFEAKPALVGTFGALVCVLLICGIIYSEKTEYTPVFLAPAPNEAAATPVITPSSLAFGQTAGGPMLISSTNPVVQPGESLFDQLQLDVQTADGHISIVPP